MDDNSNPNNSTLPSATPEPEQSPSQNATSDNQGLQTPTPISDPIINQNPAQDFQTPAITPTPGDFSSASVPAQDTSSNQQTEQTPQALPDYSSNPSQMQQESGGQPMTTITTNSSEPLGTSPQSSEPNLSTQLPNSAAVWDTPQSQQPQEGITTPQNSNLPGENAPPPVETPVMSDQLNSANFNSSPSTTQLLPGETQASPPANLMPSDSQGVPHFASTEGATSSYSPFQNNPQPPQQPESQTEESAPTDLSQLTANANGQTAQPNTVYSPTIANTDTLVVSEPSTTPNTITTEHKKGLPIIAIVGALFVLLVVAAASAYFILGIGQTPTPAQETSSGLSPVPAETPTVISTPQPSPSDTETVIEEGSGDFGTLSGEPENSGVFTTEPQASSAAEIIKARQAAQQNSPAPTPVQ